MGKSTKKRIFSGIQPSGNLHIGNYLGAIKQWADIYADYDSVFCVVDYHAITVPQDPKNLQKKVIEIAKIYLASGIDPEKAIVFQQSHVRAHVELCWLLNAVSARISDLQKMTQFKDKSSDGNINISAGLFDYPVLMAADILLYNTDVVPVGDDQLQHVELARDLAKRFNHDYTNVFKLPEAKILKQGARIMGLDNPEKKMSKSVKSELNRIELLDDPKVAMKKIMKATTDLGSEIKFDIAAKPGISNLLVIYSLLAGMEIKDLEKKYTGKLYGEFKKDLAEIVAEFLTDFQKKYNQISDKAVLDILADGACRAVPIAEATLARVKKAIGIS
ncbi:MAG: Tryptophan-tRNA ligase [Candidatus Falkowbacteria bacterium GW2011_GWC2_38_22]|uniref:Tryptophan--tRNA ligase n=1 Tax=Candidatus Falkowbacteria bacterium GW2011_GWE1_38_31 TaxID=1618638 RepID=A0A0G0JQF2_9BACT|nr:MAG: Tryptophan-tRNA ligase [Candidatus Falkowbacteria bacterium GW2011_GWF2_38_1205]KKQ60888.1 MAG: Tryptophan-tRNA ligase [Candidatus Falkowbacteria bacterium GW2011_GWC2_38_22]KKQ63006.1 MAG: Tryptophan-tRNA ligase [Candidatus Falkowbacteria bacterium GW2011_GWF1_38_22]KKQ65028.1 MAG: Tryptophan-tRNA ligase [Candidatus Falkowbacteria bacterium GW2011_GWE2_38_254]KKQ69803.1 MAG: Tryptophan-tRNA ligase [Candidatus Falkowbacteria bacterium GW2011_GWE1_38_31]KKQ72385.1 MAG: Tryptophan-tRNA l